MTNAQLYTIIALCVYAVAMALIGCISYGKSKTLDGFLIGGRNMKEQLELIKVNALAALESAETPAALEELRVKLLGKNMIARQTQIIPSEKVRQITERNLRAIAEGKRDFRF